MIIIRTNKSNYEFKYRGKVELYLDEPFLSVIADISILNTDFDRCDSKMHDKFLLEDIVSITGE